MFLKSLEIQGFKSFADKVTFSFSPGVTAIVGPNGSGKSNVVDAIRWVLGEQSAKSLRGAKMEDVIFSGSAGRKPVGMARVTMTLDNSQRIFAMDADEIEVSRILYRSGESNYKLNKNTCRLKDIQELFMDTGLGKDGFSVIGQGKIEEILTLHAEERRGLIEEAAGISKYKYRKREAERKLESTTDDMTRLDDILYELEGRIDPLAKQAEKVRVYRGLKEEADKLQLSWLTKQLTALGEAEHTEEEAVRRAHEAALRTQTALDQQEATLAEDKQKLAAERHRIEDVQAAFTDALRQTQEHEKTLTLLDERHQHTRERLETASATLAENNQALGKMQSDLKEMAAHLTESRALAETSAKDAAKAKKTLSEAEAHLTQIKTRIESLQAEQFATLSAQAETNNEITRLKQAMTGDAARGARVDARLQELQTRWDGLRQETERLEIAQKDAEAALAETNQALEKLLRERKVLEQTQAQTRQQTQALSEKRTQAKSRLETLEEFEASGEGYYQGVQQVLRAKKEQRLSGIQGSILQLLDIPSTYLTAIENALGGAAQNVVVDDDRDAQAAIAWLKKERRGRVTFMPLNLVKGKRQDVQFNDDAVIGLALDLVHYDKKYEAIMAQLLGRVWVLRDLASATALAKRTGAKHRFVTLDGDVLAPGGSMTGGHQKKQSSIVHRKYEMASLKEQLGTLEDEEAALAKRMEALDAILSKMHESYERGSAQKQEEQLALREMAVVLEQHEAQQKRLSRELELERMNRESLDAERASADEDLKKAEEKASTIAQALGKITDALKEARENLESAEEAQQQAQAKMQQVAVEQVACDKQLEHQEGRYKEACAEKLRLEKSVREIEVEKAQLSAELETLSEKRSAEKTALTQSQQSHLAATESLQAAKAHIDALEEAIRTQEKAVSELRSAGASLWRSHSSAEVRLERTKDKLGQLAEQLMENFGYSPDVAVAEADLSLDTENAAARLKALKQKITLLGEINFTAIEEYERVSEQASFLRAQLEDLNLAKEKLEAVIHEMETTMAKRFKEAYEKVNEKFSEIFTAMFGGGQARLELSMPGRYLETGVEIVAQPPGKKERVLTLLSGGERALTATALLFSLLEVRPSPFVILDEIEAALDEANVERFASFIVQYTNKTQFIIISHRKGTMEAASVLYGITMDANGVSKQVSVRLSDYDEEATL